MWRCEHKYLLIKHGDTNTDLMKRTNALIMTQRFNMKDQEWTDKRSMGRFYQLCYSGCDGTIVQFTY